MLARLSVPFVDASAGQLTWGLVPATGPPLARISVSLRGADVDLTVLGASHQVMARVGEVTCVEAVTCGGIGLSPLPRRAARDLPGLRYSVSSSVERLDPETFTGRARRLREDLGPEPRALVGSFPGHPDALTALLARADGEGVVWQTWHAYPLTGELVLTTTRLGRR